MRKLLLPASACALVLTCWLGCADENALLPAKSGCTLSSECTSPLVCAFQKCHVQCKSTKDCASLGKNSRCVQSDKPYYVCQFQEDAFCKQNSECTIRQLCAKDGQCHDKCTTNRDCLQDQVCSEGACSEPAELKDGKLTSTLSEDASVGLGCVLSTDCPGDLVCRSSVCTAECFADKDCDVGWTCKPVRPGGVNRCYPPGVSP